MTPGERAAKMVCAYAERRARELKHRRGWKETVARELDMDSAYLGKVLSGERKSVGLATLVRLQEASE